MYVNHVTHSNRLSVAELRVLGLVLILKFKKICTLIYITAIKQLPGRSVSPVPICTNNSFVKSLFHHQKCTNHLGSSNSYPPSSYRDVFLLLYHFELFVRHASHSQWVWYYERNRSFVTGHKQSGRWPVPTDKSLDVTEPKKKKSDWSLVPHHNASCRWRKFVQPVTGHTPGQTIRNGTVHVLH